MRIIDAHVHIYEHLSGYCGMGEYRPLGNGRARLACTDQVSMPFDPVFGDKGVSAENMLAFMDSHGIEKAILMQGPAFGFQNEYYMETQQKYPDRFLGTAVLDPFYVHFDEVLDRLVNGLGYKNFKFEVSDTGGMCGYHDADMLLNHPNLMKVIRELDRIGGTVAFDIGAPGTVSHRTDVLKRMVEEAPGAHFVICHLLCMTPDQDELLKKEMDMLDYPNVWYDLSALPTFTQEHAPFTTARRYLKTAMELAGTDRLIWGSDMPMTLCGAPHHDYTFEELVSVVTEAQLFTQEQLQQVFCDNALAAYRH